MDGIGNQASPCERKHSRDFPLISFRLRIFRTPRLPLLHVWLSPDFVQFGQVRVEAGELQRQFPHRDDEE